MIAVHQVLPSLHVADATGSHTLAARDVLRRAGYTSDIFVEHVDPPLSAEARPVAELDAALDQQPAVVLYQLSVGSAVVDRLLRRPEPLVVDYHNLTPASFFWEWAPDWLDAVALGHRQLRQLADRACHAVADSEFNRRDLELAGYRSTAVVAPLVAAAGPARPGGPPRAAAQAGPVRRARRSGGRWLFVGKLLPHKGGHRLVQALAAYRRAYDPDATLCLVGGAPIESYAAALRRYVADLGLADAVTFAGAVSDQARDQAYDEADVFVCLSAHEGFCFPVVEAMARGLPVVAADAGAVAETAGLGAVVLDRAGPETVAAAVHRVVVDDRLRRVLVRRGLERVAHFSTDRAGAALVAEIERACEQAGLAPATSSRTAPDRRPAPQ